MLTSETTLVAFCEEIEKIAAAGRVFNPQNLTGKHKALMAGTGLAAGAAGLGALGGGKDNRTRGAGAGLAGGVIGGVAGAAGGAAAGRALGRRVSRKAQSEGAKHVPFLGNLLYGRKIAKGFQAVGKSNRLSGALGGAAAGALGLGAAGALAGGALARKRRKKNKGLTLRISNSED